MPNKLIEWIDKKGGLWGFLAIIVAILIAVTQSYFADSDTRPPNVLPLDQTQASFPEEKSNNSKNEVYVPPPSLPKMKTATQIEKNVVEGEPFEACSMSDLFFSTLHLGQDVASLSRKHGVFFNQDGEILQDQAMAIDKPLNLSTDCSIAIIDKYEVQGHSSFKLLIERRGDK